MYRKQIRRRRALLTLLVIGSFALLSLTYGQDSGGVQRGVSTIFAPLQDVADRALKPARDLVNWFDETFDARGENRRLEAELERARRLAVRGQVAIEESRELRRLLRLDRKVVPSGYEPVTAGVVGRSPTLWYSVVTVDVGSDDGVEVNDPVLSGAGLVGHVSAVSSGSSQVTLITDPSSAVTARVVPRGVQGVVKPTVGKTDELTIDFLDSARRIGRGDVVVTAGWRAGELESHYPPNLPIGEVTEAPILDQEASQSVQLRPYADLADLDLIQVLTGGSRE